MKSDQSKMSAGINFKEGDSSPQQMEEFVSKRRPPSPVPSCVSMKSDQSKMSAGMNFKEGDSSPQQRPPSHAPTCVSMKSDLSMDLGPAFKRGDSISEHSARVEDCHSAVASPCEPLKKPELTLSGHCQLNDHRQQIHHVREMQQNHKSHLQKRFQCLIEGSIDQGNSTDLNKVYTDVYITDRGRREFNDEHEVRQIERASWREEELERAVKCNDIFKPGSGQDKPIRSVLTKGVAGIGKTVSVQKFILDWAEGKANQDVHFIFPFLFRELNLMKEKKLSLVALIQHFYSKIKAEEILTSSKNRVMFVFDGLDECRLPLQFRHSSKCFDVTEQVSVDMLLTNLIQGNLLPSALLWITTRPAAASQIPQKCMDQVTEIRGFNNPQKEEYFGKRISDENLANRIIRHLKSSRSLYIMCHIPVFCWIAAIVAERTSEESDKAEMPRTMTQMYSRFLIIQTSIKNSKYTERKETEEEIISKLGKLAFQQLEKGNLIFYDEDLREAGIDVTEASVYSGVCTQIFREEKDVYKGRVFSFVHLSIQEFLAALYVFLCFISKDRTMSQQQTSQLSALFRAATLHDLHKTAVLLALQSRNGHLDLFLRFLLGLSLESNQTHLKHLLPKTSSQSQSSVQTVQYVKEKIRGQSSSNRMINMFRGESSSDRRINLFYCLNELNQHTVVEHIDREEEWLSVEMLLPGEWKTDMFRLKMSEEQLDRFDLQTYIKTPEKDQTELLSPDDVLQKLVPVVTSSTSAQLLKCKLTKRSCSHLASVLTSHSSHLTCLDLTVNELFDSGVELLCSGLQHQYCRLETLRLVNCKLTEKCCSHLASVLTSHSSRLTCLVLSINGLCDSGMELLCSGLQHQHCRLEMLRVAKCKLTEKSCLHLASALSSQSSRLTHLNLAYNNLCDSGVELLCSGLQHQHCRLETLWLQTCKLTENSCSLLASALSSNLLCLKELWLDDNGLRDSDVEQLHSLQKDPNCRLETLGWWD
ncbi:NACHT, LRR and PYD domains-containing protein 3-like isoform X2 [Engraulis encrasicolus]|uniref:NACHT, LRR and PYD domains-containing protein 3-like isoform X2 n=1 Tax=Engraulis encrasicolus TaxID=184585 RepID=UPI002FD729EE